jgi:replicative DNA helicase
MSNVAPLFPESEQEVGARVEQALLGALLLSPRRALAALPIDFSPEHYLDPLHKEIHETIVALDKPDVLTVCAAMGGSAEERSYLASLLTCALSDSPVEYARRVTESYLRREVEGVFSKAVAMLARPPTEVAASAVIQTVMAGMDGLLSGASVSRRGKMLDEAMDAAIEQAGRAARGEAELGLSTGMSSVDRVIGFLDPATFIVLAARPGMGKTALACQWAINVARQCKQDGRGGVLGISLEMPAEKLGRRILSEASRIGIQDLRRGNITGRTDKLTKARFDLGGLPMFIEDAGGQSIAMIRQKARTAARKFRGLRMIWVDHLQIVKPEDADRRNGGTQAIGAISNALRDLSKEFDCPVLALSQLSRDLLKRDDKRPNLGDLRQAGDIEQDADVVAFIHREEAFLSKGAPPRNTGENEDKYQKRTDAWQEALQRCRGKAELIAEKVREGEPKTVPLLWDGATTSFSEPPTQLAMQQIDLADWRDEFYGNDLDRGGPNG